MIHLFIFCHQPIHPGPGVLQLGPHQPQQHLPYNMNGPRIPPPFHVNNHLQHHLHPQHPQHVQQHLPHQQHRNTHHPQFHHQQHHHHHQQHHRVNGAGDYDEYAGLMTPWQKQWLLNIQTLQLNVGVPYVVDYYYTVSSLTILGSNIVLIFILLLTIFKFHLIFAGL